MSKHIAHAQGGAADGGYNPKRLLRLRRKVVAEQEAGSIGRDVAERRTGDLCWNIERNDGATG
jgi:hypothetical protein